MSEQQGNQLYRLVRSISSPSCQVIHPGVTRTRQQWLDSGAGFTESSIDDGYWLVKVDRPEPEISACIKVVMNVLGRSSWHSRRSVLEEAEQMLRDKERSENDVAKAYAYRIAADAIAKRIENIWETTDEEVVSMVMAEWDMMHKDKH